MKKYLNIFLVFFLFSSQVSFALFEKIKVNPLSVQIRKEQFHKFCGSCQLPYKKLFENFARVPDEAWVITWSTNMVAAKVKELKKKGILKAEDKIVGQTFNGDPDDNEGKLFFLICDEKSAETLRETVGERSHMALWDFVALKGDYDLSLTQVGKNEYAFILENLEEAQYEWDD